MFDAICGQLYAKLTHSLTVAFWHFTNERLPVNSILIVSVSMRPIFKVCKKINECQLIAADGVDSIHNKTGCFKTV